MASPLHDAQELAEKARGGREQSLIGGESADRQELAHFSQMLQRRIRREPLQHILGKMWFRYLELESCPGVFIVRPETEIVAQAGIDVLAEALAQSGGARTENACVKTTSTESTWAQTARTGSSRLEDARAESARAQTSLTHATEGGISEPRREALQWGELLQRTVPERSPLIAVDLFAGSGAIALAIATELGAATQGNTPRRDTSQGGAPQVHRSEHAPASRPQLLVYGVERSATAYESAQRNNARYGNPVTFIHADALAPLPEPYEEQLVGQAALVIANPPYVPPYHELSLEVRADPQMALFGGGEDGLDIPLRTIQRASELLSTGGMLVMEHASEQAPALRTAARAAGFIDVATGKDLTGAARFLRAQWPGVAR